MFAAPGLFARRGSPGRTHRAKLVLGGVLALIGLCGLTPQAKADFTLNLNKVFDQNINPNRTFATATFTDLSGDAVRLTLTANLIGNEFIGQANFNFLDDLDVANLVFTADSGNSTTVGSANVLLGTDAHTADGAHGFDIKIELSTGNTDNRFTGTESLVWIITRNDSGSLEAADFLTPNEGNKAPIFGAVHVQSTLASPAGSLWAGDGDGDTPDTQEVPVPPSVALLALGFAGVGLTGWRRRKKADA